MVSSCLLILSLFALLLTYVKHESLALTNSLRVKIDHLPGSLEGAFGLMTSQECNNK